MSKTLILNNRSNFNLGVWRQNCLLCAAEAGYEVLCPDCLNDLPRLPASACAICSHPLPMDVAQSWPAETAPKLCGACLRHPPAFDRSVAAYRFSFPLDRLIHAFKYHHQFSLVDVLTSPLIERLRHDANLPDAIVPMPLHPLRLRERGYNQALLLGRRIAQALDLPLLADACRRTRHTAEQSRLPHAQRQTNLRGAFSCDPRVRGMRIAIIDDVMTSGSSAHHLAHTLRHQRASGVDCWIIARAIRPGT